MINKVKIWVRRNYLRIRFKYSSTPIYIKKDDRQLGLTTMLMKESLFTNTPILVKTQVAVKSMVHEMYKRGQLGIAPSYTEQYIEDNLVLATSKNYRGKHFRKVLVDNMCNEEDIKKFVEINHLIELRGFITKRFDQTVKEFKICGTVNI